MSLELLVRVGDRIGAQQAFPDGALVGRQALLPVRDVGQVNERGEVADVGEELLGPAGVGA